MPFEVRQSTPISDTPHPVYRYKRVWPGGASNPVVQDWGSLPPSGSAGRVGSWVLSPRLRNEEDRRSGYVPPLEKTHLSCSR